MATVFLRITGGKIVPEMSVPVSTTIFDLKQQIKTLINVAPIRQTLRFYDTELMNDKTLADYDIKLSADLALEVTPLAGDPYFVLPVKLPDKYIPVKVQETTLVAELRIKVAILWIYPLRNTTLTVGSTMLEDDLSPLSDYYICPGSEIVAGHIATP